MNKLNEYNEKYNNLNEIVQNISNNKIKEKMPVQDQSVQTEKVLKIRKRAVNKNATIHELRRSPRLSSGEETFPVHTIR